MNAIPREWLLDYLQRSNADYVCIENLTVNQYGFASYLVFDEEIRIIDCYGIGSYWESFFISLAKSLRKKRITFYTKRNPKVFCRRFGCKHLLTKDDVHLLLKEVM